MSGYRDIALRDLEEAEFSFKNERYRAAVFFFQQFAAKSAKALLEKKDPEHKLLKSHMVERILEGYDEAHKTSEIGDKARYLTSFYYDTRYPGDNYSEATKAQAERAKKFSAELNEYFKAELDKLQVLSNNIKIDLEVLPKLNYS